MNATWVEILVWVEVHGLYHNAVLVKEGYLERGISLERDTFREEYLERGIPREPLEGYLDSTLSVHRLGSEALL